MRHTEKQPTILQKQPESHILFASALTFHYLCPIPLKKQED